jgi:hypothetical protein
VSHVHDREHRIAKIARRVFAASYSRAQRSVPHAERVAQAFAAAEAFDDEAVRRAAELPPRAPLRMPGR